MYKKCTKGQEPCVVVAFLYTFFELSAIPRHDVHYNSRSNRRLQGTIAAFKCFIFCFCVLLFPAFFSWVHPTSTHLYTFAFSFRYYKAFDHFMTGLDLTNSALRVEKVPDTCHCPQNILISKKVTYVTSAKVTKCRLGSPRVAFN